MTLGICATITNCTTDFPETVTLLGTAVAGAVEAATQETAKAEKIKDLWAKVAAVFGVWSRIFMVL
jgi:hypothetical protein